MLYLHRIFNFTTMEQTWNSPIIVTGPVATGNSYYHRPEIVEEIWQQLEKGASILMAAPRRVGKTSVMQHLEKNPKQGYTLLFSNIEGTDSENKFYAGLFQLLLKCMSRSVKMKTWASQFLIKHKITEFDIKGSIALANTQLDFLKETDELIVEINKNFEGKIVLLLDELPTVLFNLYKKGIEGVESILENLRRWRQSTEKIRFVFAGSVGLHYVVQMTTGRSSSLNDLVKINCAPLDKSEISSYINWATNGATVQYNPELKKYLADKIAYFVPFYINLMLSETDRIARKKNNPVIEKADIDEAFNRILKNNDHFSDWSSRLSTYMSSADFSFVNELLTHISHKNKISMQEIYDKAVKHNKTTNYMDYIQDLEQDGYITKSGQNQVFVSPFLKTFWLRKNPVYNG